MEYLNQFTYQKLDYKNYLKRLNLLCQNEELKQLGLIKKTLTKTTYNYPLDYITIGHGEKEVFLIGGTHGSEYIGIDFLLNFIQEVPNIKEFDPNLFKIHILPLQNPEGFDISSNTLKNITNEEFKNTSYEYYLRYRTDSIIVFAIKELNLFFNEVKNKNLSPNQLLIELKKFFKTNPNWIKLTDKRAIPNLVKFYYKLDEIHNITSFDNLKISLLYACQSTLDEITKNTLSNQFLYSFLSIIKQGLSQEELWTDILNENFKKLYQEMFAKEDFKGLNDENLKQKIENMYLEYNHPKGSQIGHDSTGDGINLNANQPLNPGIQAIKNNQIIYGPFVKNNIKNYFPGPLGVPTLNIDNFEYTIENKVLENLINTSYENGTYLITLLYHGTGGQIFYQPYKSLMEENTYQEFYTYNKELAEIYNQATNYQILNSNGTTGYGDYLRRTYPGVLLIELSKMGGNPIGPYGDKNNIYEVFSDNTQALKDLFTYFKKTKTKKKIK